MAREPYDIFIREFLQHPAWAEVFEKLELLARDLKEQVLVGTKDTFEHNTGKVQGVYESLSLLRGLIEKSKVRG